MRNFSRSWITGLLRKRSEFFQLVAVAALLALGVHLIGVYLSGLPLLQKYIGWLGFFLSVGAIAWVMWVTLRELSASFNFGAAFLFDPTNRKLITIPDYEFSEKLCRALTATIAENKGLENIWNTEPLRDYRPPSSEKDASEAQKSATGGTRHFFAIRKVSAEATGEGTDKPILNRRSVALLKEAIEYVILEKLSLHLSARFDNDADRDSLLRRYKREDIPDLLLRNRVLALLTSPYEDRAAFSDKFFSNKPGEELIAAYAEGGELYHRFELVLPKGTKIQRLASGELELDSPRVCIRFKPVYENFVSNDPPASFIALVLRRRPADVDAQKVHIEFSYFVKPLALLRSSGWEYYEWVDSFTMALQKFASIRRHLKKIRWPSVELVSRIVLQRLQKPKQHPAPPEAPNSPSLSAPSAEASSPSEKH